MKLKKLHSRLLHGEKGLNGWCSIPSTVTAEIMSGYDFDSLTIDLQHGLIDYQTALLMMQSIVASGITPIARVPWNEPGIIMKLLDAGAMGIICPMINSATDAKKFVEATKYSPIGYRSTGPTRAVLIHGKKYHQEANETIISLAMVETVEALNNVDEIAATEGLSGIYIGPSDLSVSMGFEPGLDREEPKIEQAFKRILSACEKNNIIAAIHCLSSKYIKNRYEIGFNLVTISTDIRLFGQILGERMDEIRK